MKHLRIEVGHKADGFVFRLDPKSIESLKKPKKGITQLPTVSIGFDTRAEFENIHGPIYTHIAQLLTGLSEEELKDETIDFIDSLTNKKIFVLPS